MLAVAYGLLLVMGISWAARGAGFAYPAAYDPTLQLLLAINFAGFVWRGIWRFAFAARQYGVQEGLRAVMRIPVSNLIAIMAGRRALFAYARSLAGERVVWDKTDHAAHPVLMREQGARV